MRVRLSPHSASYALGCAIGDVFTDKYFSLPAAGRARWDRTRLMHHGALGELVAKGASRFAESIPRGAVRDAASIVREFGEGLAESDRHDEHLWWTDGVLASTVTLLVLALDV